MVKGVTGVTAGVTAIGGGGGAVESIKGVG